MSTRNLGIIYRICLLFLMAPDSIIWGYEKEEHAAINDWILEKSVGGFDFDQYVKKYLGIDGGMDDKCIRNATILNWLTISDYDSPKELVTQGGIEEDQPPTRVLFHFHDPSKAWDQAGLFGKRDSLVLWSQRNKGGQSLSILNGGDYSWHDAREYFHSALTADDMEHRNTALKKTFLAVGHLMHLIQDSSVPEHVRDDAHVGCPYEHMVQNYHQKENRSFENWLKGEYKENDITKNGYTYDEAVLRMEPNELAPIPIARIVDTEQYREGKNPYDTVTKPIGLAEYTNANYLSSDTIFKEDSYHYPKYGSSVERVATEIRNPRNEHGTIQRNYMNKIADGETGYKLCTVSILWQNVAPSNELINSYLETSFLDENVLVGYAERLVPRAVSYSAGLLKYFFRGTLEITLPENGVYAARDSVPEDPARQGFGTVSLHVKNTTSTGESLLGGKYTLVVQYRLLTDNPNSTDPATGAKDPFVSASYESASFNTTKPLFIVQAFDTQSNHTLANGASTLLTFTLDKEIPLWAADVRFSVVYRGVMGYSLSEPGVEEDAVCVGFLDVSEPTPIDFGNSVDTFCIDDVWYNLMNASDRETINAAYPSAGGGVGFPCLLDHQPADLQDLYVKFSSINASVVASPTQYNFHIERIPPGMLKRLFVITDYDFTQSYYSASYASPTTIFSNNAMQNGMTNDNGTVGWIYPTFDKYREVESWTRSDLKEPCDACPKLATCPNCSEDKNPFAYEMMP